MIQQSFFKFNYSLLQAAIKVVQQLEILCKKKNQRTINQFPDFSIFLSFTGNDGDSDDSDDHEEEFYYTEVELIVSEPSTSPNATSRYDHRFSTA